MVDPENTPFTLPATPERAQDMRRAARNISVLMLASVLSKGILLVWQIVLGNWLGPTEYGLYNTVISLGAVAAPIVNFGIGLIAIREVSRKPELAGRYWTAMLFTQTLLFIVAYLVMVIASVIVRGGAGSDEIVAFAAVSGISLLIDVFGSISNDLLIAQERMTITAAVDVGTITLRVLLVATVVSAGWGLAGIYLMTILVGILRFAVLWGVHFYNGLRPEWPLDRAITWGLLSNGWPLAINALIAQMYDHSDKIMTTAIIGETNTGYLSPAFLIKFGVVELLSTTVVVATYPIMSRYYEEGDGSMFGFMVEKMARFMLLVSLPIALVFTFFSGPIIMLIYSEEYAPVIGIMPIFMWYTVLTMVGSIFSRALLIQNKQRIALMIRIVGLVLNVILNLVLLVGYRDPRGAAIATIVAESVSLVLMMRVFRAPGFSWGVVIGGALRILGWGAASAIVMVLLGSIHYIPGIAGGLLVYAAGCFWLPVLGRDDWDLVYRVVAAMPGGHIIRRYWHRDVAVNW
ncbi:flippase [Phototrophicus methaneseepsis]|uniref:Flippase n=1 Tax=Phototrophicus methaneseepsis TaxID=2710758 RepID=A0A7S8IEN0_9CHLR|nr:flippase [Phototrophicus methaneseepsis]QPC82619.1 flippase [Phototrophicus methaneseepsis]